MRVSLRCGLVKVESRSILLDSLPNSVKASDENFILAMHVFNYDSLLLIIDILQKS